MGKILQGDCYEQLKTLPDNSVNCCVTSPPYFNLRDYGTAEWVGGDPNCSHSKPYRRQTFHEKFKNTKEDEHYGEFYKDVCPLCGARRVDKQIGIENSPKEYIDNLVKVFHEVKRVLKDDGTLWVNIGDTYNSGPTGSVNSDKQKTNEGSIAQTTIKGLVSDCKPKDLIGIPWMLAFALREDGWYLRQDVIWAKPNPMPESVTDRCTKSHEYIFMLTKSPSYYFDQESIKELSVSNDGDYAMRNKRDVWNVPVASGEKEAHFAVFPEKLIEPCIIASCPVGGVVLDPFFGSGTTGKVAKGLDRDYLGIELNPEYVEIANRKINGLSPKSETDKSDDVDLWWGEDEQDS